MTMNRLHAAHALLPNGWAEDVLLEWDASGMLSAARADAGAPDGTPRAAGVVVPGMPNLHSHAFQRGFAGLAEFRGAGHADSFWTWRDLMYRFALKVTPDQLEAIATRLYVEMLQAGYTAVCEFHYLHHDPQGRPYADPSEMGQRLIAAARRAGIGLTLLPVLYQHGGFGGQPSHADQRRFVSSTDELLAIAQRLRATGTQVGVAPHSLRAVGPQALHALVAATHAADPFAPVHLHIAEQQAEVDACLAWSGARPVEWLLAHAPVDARWCLVHATHLEDAERRAYAATGAVAGLCPTTEANLGDGVFDAAAWHALEGAWGIGSDSHASVDAAEELRWLEYGQRLARQQRSVLATHARPQVADTLWLSAVSGGARASGRPIAGLQPGEQADFLVLDARGVLAGLAPAQQLAAHVFAPQGRGTVRDVWVGGVQRVSDGDHALAAASVTDFVAARAALLTES